ncbi:MAG: MMPL family transporter [Sulfolobaceae archaeon]
MVSSKIVVVIWTIIILISLFLASQSSTHITYNENITFPNNSKAYIAYELLSEYFPSGSGNNSIDVVLINATPYENYLVEEKILQQPLVTNASGLANVYISYATFLGKAINETGKLINESAFALYVYPQLFTKYYHDTKNLSEAEALASHGMPTNYTEFYQTFAEVYASTHNYTIAFEEGISKLNKTQLVALYVFPDTSSINASYISYELPNAVAKVLNISPQISALLLFKSIDEVLNESPSQFFSLITPPSSLIAIYEKNNVSVILVYTKYSPTYSFENGTLADELAVPYIQNAVKSTFNGKFYITGTTPLNAQLSKLSNEYGAITFVLVFFFLVLVIGIYFRSIIAPLITLTLISLSTIIGFGLVTVISIITNQLINFQVIEPMITVLMGIGADYSVFLLSRYREELGKGVSKEEAMRISVRTSGRAIIISGLSVTLVFLSMAFIPFASQWGLAIGVSVPFTVGIAVTLLPIIYGKMGWKVFWPSKNFKVRPRFENAVRNSVKRYKTVIISSLIIGALVGFYLISIPLNLNFTAYLPNTPAVQGLNVIENAFGENYLNPVLIVFNYSHPISINDLEKIGQFELQLEKMNGVEEVFGPVPPGFNGTITPAVLSDYKENVGLNNRTLLVTVIPSYKYDTVQAYQLVKNIQSLASNYNGYVGGTTAYYLAFMNYLFPYYHTLLVLLPLALAIVVSVFIRSFRVGIGVSLSILLSIGLSLAVVYILFQVSPDVGILFIVPILVFVLMMGLGNDYSIFILTRVKEEFERGTDEAIVKGLSVSANTVTALGVILAFSFGALVVNPIKSIQELGLAIALAALFDTFIIRVFIYPAILHLALPKRKEKEKE